jgi:hypothetical protein
VKAPTKAEIDSNKNFVDENTDKGKKLRYFYNLTQKIHKPKLLRAFEGIT